MKHLDLYKDGNDIGYIGNNQSWWFDINHPDSFEIFDLDGFYAEPYFKEDHANPVVASNFVSALKKGYKHITNKDLTSVFEAGAGGGWITECLLKENIDVIALEGARSGYEKALKRGISKNNILHHDLRKDINLNRKFDITCCTEVAEHIETPFSSQLIKTLTQHSDIVWFSFEAPNTNAAHYHHCNEQPEKFWINIFDFYGYNFIRLNTKEDSGYFPRGTHIFYKKGVYNI